MQLTRHILLWVLAGLSISGLGQNTANIQNEQLAQQFFQNEAYDKAANLYAALYDKDPAYYTPYLICLTKLQDYTSAKKLIKKQIKHSPGMLVYQVDLGVIYYKTGKQKTAQKTYQKAIEESIGSEAKVLQLAEAFSRNQLTRYAIQTYLSAIKHDPTKAVYRYEVARLFEGNGQQEEMMEQYIYLLSETPQHIPKVQDRIQDFLTDDPEGEKAAFIKTSLLRAIQKDKEQSTLDEVMIWLALQTGDYPAALRQSMAMDKKLKEDGERIYALAKLCMENKRYLTAIDCYTYLKEKAEDHYLYEHTLIGMAQTHYLIIAEKNSPKEEDLLDVQQKMQEALHQVGIDQNSFSLALQYAQLLGIQLRQTDSAIMFLSRLIKNPKTNEHQRAEAKITLGDMYLMAGDIWESSLIYKQVELDFKHHPLGHTAKLKNARLSFYRGDFFWAQAQLDILKAATSKLIANDAMELSLLISDNIAWDSSLLELSLYAKADLLLKQNKDNEAITTLDSIKTLSLSHPIFDEVLYKKSQIAIRQEQYRQAVELLNKICTAYSFDILADDALFLQAKLYEEQLENKAKAQTLYKELLINHPGSIYTSQARKRFRAIRGDNLK